MGLSIDATGYTYPTAKTITIPDEVSATITLTPMISDGKFKYKWSDDTTGDHYVRRTLLTKTHQRLR